jgi:hypothetical protein
MAVSTVAGWAVVVLSVLLEQEMRTGNGNKNNNLFICELFYKFYTIVDLIVSRVVQESFDKRKRLFFSIGTPAGTLH